MLSQWVSVLPSFGRQNHIWAIPGQRVFNDKTTGSSLQFHRIGLPDIAPDLVTVIA